MGLVSALRNAGRRLDRWMRAKGVPLPGLPDRAPMTNWLSPPRLAAVGVDALISGLFGEFADRREAQANVRPDHGDEQRGFIDRSNPEAPADGDGSFWVDYLADTGDGWNPTYAMARLLCAPSLEVSPRDAGAKPMALPRGSLLVMGGDQVYPVASPSEYERRLVSPFRQAAERVGEEAAGKGEFGELFAIPGNHDWYDGLRSFMGVFCRAYDALGRKGKVIGGRKTSQSRSYFAIKLPHDWWLWGLDSQLKGYIDQPQVDYFSRVARAMHAQAEESGKPFKLIVCTGYPSWTNVDPANPNERFGSFSYMERLINNYGKVKPGETAVGGKVCLSISGDTHHYARHTEQGPGADVRHYVTCGGGGAYTHPTLQVKDEIFRWQWPLPGEQRAGGRNPHGWRKFELARFDDNGKKAEALYPSKAQSKRAAWEALALAFRNGWFTLTMSLVSLVLLRTAMASLHSNGAETGFGETVNALWKGATSSLVMLFYALLLAAALAYAADRKGSWTRLAIGSINAAIQLATILAACAAALCWTQDWPWWAQWARPISAAGLAGIASATALGAYFIFCLRCFEGMHWNEAFLGLRSTRYKSMLRMRFDPAGGLTLHAIGLQDCETGGFLGRFFGNPRTRPVLEPRLIEPPVTIR